jgi:hypothetical protein
VFVTWKSAAVRPIPAGMRFYFHIVDKYGLSPDRTGCEHTDQDAAVLHARRIAAELAKAGEFCRSSVVLLAAVPGPSSSLDQGGIAPTEGLTAMRRRPAPADFLPLLPTENP